QKLTTELDVRKARELERLDIRPENGYISLRERTDLRPVRHQVHYSPVVPLSDHRWRYEQNRRGILPRNPPPTSFFYGGDVEVDSYGGLN
uniref:hypothetical protein n=1 Tax=Salmonella sp. s51933 TaxID=3160127 RepID=UPI003754F9B3